MREVQQKNYTYSNDNYFSVFVGYCESEETLLEYLEKDYELLDDDCIGSEFGIDFGINTYDEDFLVVVFNAELSTKIDEIFKDAMVFDINELRSKYPNDLKELYNSAIVIIGLKYEGTTVEVKNDEFGRFKFLGTFLR